MFLKPLLSALLLTALLAQVASAAELRIGIVDFYDVRDALVQLVITDAGNAALKQRIDGGRDEMNQLRNDIRGASEDEGRRAELQRRLNALNNAERELEQRWQLIVQERAMRVLESLGGGRYALVLTADARGDGMLYKRPEIELIDLTHDMRAKIVQEIVAAGGSAEGLSDED